MTTRRKFFARLLGAAAAVPVLLTGGPTRAAQTSTGDLGDMIRSLYECFFNMRLERELDQDHQDRIDNLVRRFVAETNAVPQ